MKSLLAIGSLLLITLGGCQKSAGITEPVPAQTLSPVTTPAADTKPVASFTINNLIDGKILESNVVDFVNDSKNANSYSWNFGNSITSTDKVPQDEVFDPCGAVYSITLTVKNNAGETASCSKTFEVLCKGKNAHRDGTASLVTHLDNEALKHFAAN